MTTERAVLAGGCFWGMQDLIRRRPGVVSTRVGYTGGDVSNATYRNHGTHAEGIEIMFDPAKTSYRELLEFFFSHLIPACTNRILYLRCHLVVIQSDTTSLVHWNITVNVQALPKKPPHLFDAPLIPLTLP